jgi:uncharacterized protein
MSLDTRQSVIRRALFATLGALAVALAVVGVFVPGIPTTIFVIAASYLFARSSPACEAWLERSPLLGPPLRRFRETGGMPAKSKGVALVSMWTGVAVKQLRTDGRQPRRGHRDPWSWNRRNNHRPPLRPHDGPTINRSRCRS